MFNFLKDKLKAAISGLTKKAETEIEKSAKNLFLRVIVLP